MTEYKQALKGKKNPEKARESMVYNIREGFLRYFVNLFKNYEKYITVSINYHSGVYYKIYIFNYFRRVMIQQYWNLTLEKYSRRKSLYLQWGNQSVISTQISSKLVYG